MSSSGYFEKKKGIWISETKQKDIANRMMITINVQSKAPTWKKLN